MKRFAEFLRRLFCRPRLLTGDELQAAIAAAAGDVVQRANEAIATLEQAKTELAEAKLDYARRAVEHSFATDALEREKLELREYVNLGAVHVRTHVEMWRGRN